jgi:hypothetical protein
MYFTVAVYEVYFFEILWIGAHDWPLMNCQRQLQHFRLIALLPDWRQDVTLIDLPQLITAK